MTTEQAKPTATDAAREDVWTAFTALSHEWKKQERGVHDAALLARHDGVDAALTALIAAAGADAVAALLRREPDDPWQISVGPSDALLLFAGNVVGRIYSPEQERRIDYLLNAGERAARQERA